MERVENRVQRMQAIRACVAATVRRDLKEPVAPVERSHEERVTFLVAPIPVADIPRSYSFYNPVVSDDSGRNSREEITGSTGNKKSTPLGESVTTGCREERKIPQPETFTHSDTGNYRSRSGSVQTTTNGRLGDADFGLSAPYRTEGASRDCIP